MILKIVPKAGYECTLKKYSTGDIIPLSTVGSLIRNSVLYEKYASEEIFVSNNLLYYFFDHLTDIETPRGPLISVVEP